MKFIKLILLVVMAVPIVSFHYNRQHNLSELLYGKWDFIKFYEGRTEIKDKKGVQKMWPTMNVYKTYDRNGNFFYLEDDMTEEGGFLFNENNSIIKEFANNGKKSDTAFLEVTYLDSNYLVYVAPNKFTYLYKKR